MVSEHYIHENNMETVGHCTVRYFIIEVDEKKLKL